MEVLCMFAFFVCTTLVALAIRDWWVKLQQKEETEDSQSWK